MSPTPATKAVILAMKKIFLPLVTSYSMFHNSIPTPKNIIFESKLESKKKNSRGKNKHKKWKLSSNSQDLIIISALCLQIWAISPPSPTSTKPKKNKPLKKSSPNPRNSFHRTRNPHLNSILRKIRKCLSMNLKE